MDDTSDETNIDEGSTSFDSPADNLPDPRAECISKYVKESLAEADPLAAMLGAVNGDLMLMAYAIKQVFSESIEQQPESLKEIAEFMPAVDNYLKVSKQIHCMTQLSIKLKGMNGKG